MDHLRYANLNGWVPPARYQALRGLIQLARIDGPSDRARDTSPLELVEAEGEDLFQELDDADSDVIIMADEDEFDLVSVASDVDADADDVQIVKLPSVAQETLDEVISRMFSTPTKRKAAAAKPFGSGEKKKEQKDDGDCEKGRGLRDRLRGRGRHHVER